MVNHVQGVKSSHETKCLQQHGNQAFRDWGEKQTGNQGSQICTSCPASQPRAASRKAVASGSLEAKKGILDPPSDITTVSESSGGLATFLLGEKSWQLLKIMCIFNAKNTNF